MLSDRYMLYQLDNRLGGCVIPVTIAGGSHLFPFRTQKLSLPAPMVLPGPPVGEWVVAGMTQPPRVFFARK